MALGGGVAGRTRCTGNGTAGTIERWRRPSHRVVDRAAGGATRRRRRGSACGRSHRWSRGHTSACDVAGHRRRRPSPQWRRSPQRCRAPLCRHLASTGSRTRPRRGGLATSVTLGSSLTPHGRRPRRDTRHQGPATSTAGHAGPRGPVERGSAATSRAVPRSGTSLSSARPYARAPRYVAPGWRSGSSVTRHRRAALRPSARVGVCAVPALLLSAEHRHRRHLRCWRFLSVRRGCAGVLRPVARRCAWRRSHHRCASRGAGLRRWRIRRHRR